MNFVYYRCIKEMIHILNKIELNKEHAILLIHSDTHGDFEILIDLEDVDVVQKYKWGISAAKSPPYDYVRYYATTSKNSILLHRYLTDCPNDMVVDHIDGNSLNNRRENLRVCTDSQNKKNCKKYANNKSGYKGVIWYHYRNINKWMSYICVDNKRITLGYFEDIKDAVECRKNAEKKYFGEYAFNESL